MCLKGSILFQVLIDCLLQMVNWRVFLVVQYLAFLLSPSWEADVFYSWLTLDFDQSITCTTLEPQQLLSVTNHFLYEDELHLHLTMEADCVHVCHNSVFVCQPNLICGMKYYSETMVSLCATFYSSITLLAISHSSVEWHDIVITLNMDPSLILYSFLIFYSFHYLDTFFCLSV